MNAPGCWRFGRARTAPDAAPALPPAPPPAASCVHMVNRAGRTGSRRLNFVISHFFMDADKDFVVDRYCLKLSGARRNVGYLGIPGHGAGV